MDNANFFGTVAALLIANGASFAFFMGAMKISRHEKETGASDGAPIWCYLCLMCAPFLLAVSALLA